MNWVNCDDELPPADGIYEVTNHPEFEFVKAPCHIGVLSYDGFGFLYDGIYRPVQYWRHYLKPEKKYGKQK